MIKSNGREKTNGTLTEKAMLEMVTAGIDVGNSTTKAVVLHNGHLSYAFLPIREESTVTADRALRQALENAGLNLNDVRYVMASGAGGKDLKLTTDGYLSAISCAVKGINNIFPSVKTVVDVGAEGFIVAKCDGRGKLLEYEQHQKCGSGGGLFLELAAEVLEVGIDKMGELSLQAAEDIQITATCAVFAESEIVSLIHKGKKRADILKAVHNSIAGRIVSLLSAVGIENDVAFIGGVARNAGMVDAVKRLAKVEILVPEVPEIVVALGAALAAREKAGEVR